MTARRGRPPGTMKRDEAIAAAEAIVRGEYATVREAAAHFRPNRIGSDEGFRDFVRYVEEALRDTTIGGLRAKFKALATRGKHRGRQHGHRPVDRVKDALKEAGLEDAGADGI